jgi:hypothetical protein
MVPVHLGAARGRPGHWSNHSLYDPQDGSTYDVTAELTAPNAILRGFIAVCRSLAAQKYDSRSAAERRRTLLSRSPGGTISV